MTHVEDKIRKLLALAAHPNTPVDEARTAAVTAARLMAENKVEVGVAVAPIFGPPNRREDLFNPPMSRFVAFGTLIHELIEIMLRERHEPPRPPPRPPERDPMLDPRFWDEWEKRQKRPRRRKKTTSKRRKVKR
jgi:uncharacterized protein DUF2786